jgi:hypothetical protein
MSAYETTATAQVDPAASTDFPADVPPIEASTVFWAAQSLVTVHGDDAPLIAAERVRVLEREGKTLLADAFDRVRLATLELLQGALPLPNSTIH